MTPTCPVLQTAPANRGRDSADPRGQGTSQDGASRRLFISAGRSPADVARTSAGTNKDARSPRVGYPIRENGPREAIPTDKCDAPVGPDQRQKPNFAARGERASLTHIGNITTGN